jgi:predicted DNA-binding protein
MIKMSKTISASIPDNLAVRLEIFLKETKKSESFHIQKALESYLEDYADLNKENPMPTILTEAGFFQE